MFVSRKTMDAAVEAARAKGREELLALASRYGAAFDRVSALQQQMEAWLNGKADGVTPEQAADLFYAQDAKWQAAFFNCLPDRVMVCHNSMPEPRPGVVRFHPGVPPGESQWFWMAEHLDAKGRETLESMHGHMVYYRNKGQ